MQIQASRPSVTARSKRVGNHVPLTNMGSDSAFRRSESLIWVGISSFKQVCFGESESSIGSVSLKL